MDASRATIAVGGNCNAVTCGNNNNIIINAIPLELFNTLQKCHEHIMQLHSIIDAKDKTIDELQRMLEKQIAAEIL